MTSSKFLLMELLSKHSGRMCRNIAVQMVEDAFLKNFCCILLYYKNDLTLRRIYYLEFWMCVDPYDCKYRCLFCYVFAA